MVSLSLCLIVKNEQEMLPPFLAAIAGVADEIVAVDTGSTDATVEILRAAGARIAHHTWDGDFAAARNASLALATGQFALILDPDERVPPEFGPALRAALADPSVGAATIHLRSTFAHGHHRDAQLLRVLPVDPSVRFRHRIHEDASEDLAPWLRAHKRRLAAIAPTVLHLGYERDRAAERDKKSRDGEALAACVAADPRDLYSRYKLLELARFWSDADLAQEAARECQARLLDAIKGRDEHLLSMLATAPWAGELILLLARALHPGQPARALAVVEALCPESVRSAPLELGRGELLEQIGRAAAARAAFSRCLQITTEPTAMTRSVRPHMGLARIALAEGSKEAAARHCALALAAGPRDPEALLLSALLAPDGPRAFHTAHQGQHGGSPELDAAVGEALLNRRSPSEALPFLTRAAGDPPRGSSAELLALAWILAGDPLSACVLAGRLPEALPSVLALRQVAALAAAQAPQLPPRAALTEEAEALASLLQRVAESGRHDISARVLSSLALLLPRHPWLAEVQ